MAIYENIIALLKKYNIPYKEYDHDPILNYEDAEKQKKLLKWEGIESKNVFLKGADGRYFLYVTTQGQRLDFGKLKELLGTKLSLASDEDVRVVIECIPGCVAPFGFSKDIIVLLDKGIFKYDDYLFSPGVTTKTIQLNIKDIAPIFKEMLNNVIELNNDQP